MSGKKHESTTDDHLDDEPSGAAPPESRDDSEGNELDRHEDRHVAADEDRELDEEELDEEELDEEELDEEDGREEDGREEDSPAGSRRSVVPLVGIAAVLLVGWLGYLGWQAHRGLDQAKLLAPQGRWPQVRRHLERYLWIHPGDHRARMMLAEAYVRDDLLGTDEGAARALAELARVPDTAEQAAAAHTQAGRVKLLILRTPAAAERSLRRAIELDDQLIDAHYMLWKLMDLTGRSEVAEETFWDVYRLTPAAARAVRLREWYMSQFYPATANPDLERKLGFLREGEHPSVAVEFRRLASFEKLEPDDPLGPAAVANWLRIEGDPKQAVKVLEEGAAARAGCWEHPFFVRTMIASLIDLGEFERAEELFRAWPGPKTGPIYWKWEAIVADEVLRDNSRAIAAYEKALAAWPGPADWRTRNRLANCLSRAGQVERSREERLRAKKIEKMMDEDVHRPLRAALGQLGSASELAKVVAFYRDLGCRAEAKAWQAEIARLTQPSP